MASIIKIKRSNAAGNAPTTSDITTGELALNINDGRLYSSRGASVFEVGSSVHSLAVGTGTFSFANGAVTLPGGDGTSGQTLVTDGAGNVAWQNLDVGNNYSIQASTATADVETQLSTLTSSDQVVANPDGFLSFKTGATTVAKVPYFGTATDGVNVTLDLGDDVASNTYVNGTFATIAFAQTGLDYYASNTALQTLKGRVDVIDGGTFS